MKKILLITHKTYGKALISIISKKLDTAANIIYFIGFEENEGIEELDKKISSLALEEYSICFVDLKGGTPANVCISSFWTKSDITILMGVTPQMLLFTIEQRINDKIIDDDMIKSIKRIGVSSIQFNYL